jgi:hypothetical protein
MDRRAARGKRAFGDQPTLPNGNCSPSPGVGERFWTLAADQRLAKYLQPHRVWCSVARFPESLFFQGFAGVPESAYCPGLAQGLETLRQPGTIG